MEPELFCRLFEKSRLLENGCIEWIGSYHKQYPTFFFKKIKYENVKRLIWSRIIGPISNKLSIRQKCNNYFCVNINHFEPMTNEKFFTRDKSYYITILKNINTNENGCKLFGNKNKHIYSTSNKVQSDLRRKIYEIDNAVPHDHGVYTKCGNFNCIALEHIFTGKTANPTSNEKIKQNFYLKTKINGDCIIWTGQSKENGYGTFKIHRKSVGAHRIAFEFENGKIESGMLIRHLCHNKLCVNVQHLKLGNSRDNALDTLKIGGGTAKLNEQNVLEIIHLINNGSKLTTIAKLYHVTAETIGAVKRGITWSHVTSIQYKQNIKPLNLYKEKLYSKTINYNECILWTGIVKSSGYGEMSVNGKMLVVHRLSYFIANNITSLPNEYVVRHLCHNKLCINPVHLAHGTEAQNSYDTNIAGNNKSARLNLLQVKEVKELLANNKSVSAIAKTYSVSYNCIWNIAINKTWHYV